MALVARQAEWEARNIRFELVADDLAGRFSNRINRQMMLLMSTHSFLAANQGALSRAAFRSYVSGIGFEIRFGSLESIGFARRIDRGEEHLAETDIANFYDATPPIRPESQERWRAPVVLVEPFNEKTVNMLGYDMFAEEVPRQSMRDAMMAGEARASPPVPLTPLGDRLPAEGMYIFMPIEQAVGNGNEASSKVTGFAFGLFRIAELYRNVLERSPDLKVEVKAVDPAIDGEKLLFQTSGYDAEAIADIEPVERDVDIAGRTWKLFVRPAPALAKAQDHAGSYAIAGVSMVLALTLAVAAHAQLRVISTAHALNLFTARSMKEKDLMLQEMQHRIKNSISRILAMARQTAANSDTMEEFSQSFAARLQAMANAQDLLSRSRWHEADLEEHLSIELRQVFGEEMEQARLAGPPVRLDEDKAQALGLTFHELATNAMKYGGMSEKTGGLTVNWSLEGEGQDRKLVLDWIENAAGEVLPPGNEGFGTKLMDASIKGRLNGTIERRFDNGGLRVRISIPMPAKRARERKKLADA